MSKQVMEQALEALENSDKLIDQLLPGVKHLALQDYAFLNTTLIRNKEAIAALKEAIKQQGEPVAWMHNDPARVDIIHEKVKSLLGLAGHFHRPLDKSENYTIPLYTSAPTIPEDWKLMDMGWLRQMIHVNFLRCYPEKSHEEIGAEIDKVLSAAPEYKHKKDK